VITSAGKLPYRSIIHVAGINMFWRASEKSIRGSVHNTIRLVNKNNLNSVAFPIIGAGSGSFRQSRALEIMIDELAHLDTNAKVVIVEFQKRRY
jgi:O-acetyl-ADP-ribose deacetylase